MAENKKIGTSKSLPTEHEGVVGMQTNTTGKDKVIIKPGAEEKTKEIAKAEPIAPPKNVETVEVPKEDLAAFVKRLKTLEDDNKRLLDVADKGRLASVDAKRTADQPLIRTVKLSKLNEKFIVAWNLEKNISYMDGNKRVENQVMKVFFEDGTDKEMPLIDFYRNCNKQTIAEIITRTKKEGTDEEILEVETKDGQRLKIPLKFVN